MPQHDFIIENAGGRAVRTDFNNALAALVGISAGPIEPPTPYAGMLWLDLSVLPDGLVRQRNVANTGWNPIGGIPAKASVAEVVAGIDDTKFVTPYALAQRLAPVSPPAVPNKVVNPAMQISQQNGDSGVASGGYPADNWITLVPAAVAAALQRVASITPRKSPKRLRIQITTGKTPLVTTDTLQFYQAIEGNRLTDFGWGAAGARPVILRFGFRGPAGTYTASIRNGGGNRSYLKNFTISAGQANADTEQVFVIPGDVTGTWNVDTTVGIYLAINMGSGPTYVGLSDVWQAGNFLVTATTSNGAATVGNIFELFDVGLYLDVASGIAPHWQFPDEAAELRLCQRYYTKNVFVQFGGGVTSGGAYFANAPLPVDMRTTPTLAGVDSPAASGFVSTTGTLTAQSLRNVREARSATGTTAAGLFTSLIEANARL